jgi:protein-S-isoprenylcysteine O-methyltransferase Ste14
MHNGVPDNAHVIALPPFIYATAFIVGLLLHLVFPIHPLPSMFARWLGLLLIFISAVIAVSALCALRREQTTFDVSKPTTAIVTDGPYYFSRNPLYVSVTLLYLGVACWINALWIILMVIPALVVMQRGVIDREEAYLERKFGEEYLSYKRQVRRWI